MFQTDPVAAGSFPDCPDEAESSGDEGRHMSLGPVHVLCNILVRAGGGCRFARSKGRIFELLSGSGEVLVKLLADKVWLSRTIEELLGLGSIDAEEEWIVLDEGIESKFRAEAILGKGIA